MKIERSYILLQKVRFHAFHGVMPQERKVGADFEVSMRVALDLARPVESDEVADTLNYATLYELVSRAMAQPSQLLEHVAGRIGRDVMDAFSQVESIDILLTKLNPPMGAECAGAGVELHLINDKTRR